MSLSGDLSGDVETISAMPITAEGYYRGSVTLGRSSPGDPAVPGNGALELTHGETIIASALALSANATVDCTKRVCLIEASPTPSSGDCDLDGVLDPGERWIVELELANAQTEAFSNATVSVSADYEYVEPSDPSQPLATLNPFDPWQTAVEIHLLPGATFDRQVVFDLSISGQGWDADDAECEALGWPAEFTQSTNRDGAGPDSWSASAPADLAESAASCPGELELTWDAVAGAGSYSVYRSAQSCDDALERRVPYATTPQPMYVDQDPTQEAPSFYAVAATEVATGCTTERACIRASCCPAPDDPAGLRLRRVGDDIELTWEVAPLNGVVWNIYRDNSRDPAAWGQPLYPGVVDAAPSLPGIQHVDTSAVLAGSPLYYLVTADNGCAESTLF